MSSNAVRLRLHATVLDRLLEDIVGVQVYLLICRQVQRQSRPTGWANNESAREASSHQASSSPIALSLTYTQETLSKLLYVRRHKLRRHYIRRHCIRRHLVLALNFSML
jgi:hypothetical protein